jgi:hypothetical protein
MQAQTVARRLYEAGTTWAELDQLIAEHGLPERTLDAMFDAVLGYRGRRAGNGRGRYYIAGVPIRQIQDRHRSERQSLRDPYPLMRAKPGGRG